MSGDVGGVERGADGLWIGPGGLTKAMLDLKNVKRVISIEEAFRYQPMLQVRSCSGGLG